MTPFSSRCSPAIRTSCSNALPVNKRGRWLNVELPNVTQPRVDLLFEIERTLELIALELQSRNDPLLPLRMAEYALFVGRLHKRFPKQYVLYVGSGALRMPSELITRYLTCRYTIIDIREWDAETLLKSPHPADAVLTILGKYSDRLNTIRRILRPVAKTEVGARKIAFSKLVILAGIRNLAGLVRQEAEQMPITEDIMDHEIIGPAIRKGREQGLREGEVKGKAEGKIELLHRLLTARFGPMSAITKRRLAKLTLPELDDLAIRLLSAKTIDQLFQR